MGPDSVVGRALLVEVVCDPSCREVGASVKESASDRFEDCRDCGATQRLMCKFDAVGFGLDGVREQSEIRQGGV